jgi:hypothetical protein
MMSCDASSIACTIEIAKCFCATGTREPLPRLFRLIPFCALVAISHRCSFASQVQHFRDPASWPSHHRAFIRRRRPSSTSRNPRQEGRLHPRAPLADPRNARSKRNTRGQPRIMALRGQIRSISRSARAISAARIRRLPLPGIGLQTGWQQIPSWQIRSPHGIR